MDLFDKFSSIVDARAELARLDADPFSVRMDEVLSPTEAIIDGKRTLLAGTNNYLGLTFDPDCVEALKKAADTEGTGTTGSRVANGTYSGHSALEASLADFFKRRSAMLFSTGYQANLGILASLGGPKDYILIDADCHASIYDGCKMSTATVIRFRHNDPADLEKKLRRLDKEVRNKLVVVEGIYSMLGDTAPLADFAEIAERYNAYLMVDEAHSVGVIGEQGRGLAEHLGVEDKVDFVVGTFSKSLGTIGGFCVSDHPKFDILRVVSRPYMFTASLPPSTVASALVALDIMRDRPSLRTQLWRNVQHLYGGLSALGFELGAEPSPVVAVRLPDRETAAFFWKALLEAGIYVNLAVPPATPHGWSLLRCSLCAAHTPEELDLICDAFAEVGRRTGLVTGSQKTAIAG